MLLSNAAERSLVVFIFSKTNSVDKVRNVWLSSYRKKDSVKLWGGKCNSLVLFLKLLLHLNNGRTKGKDGNTQEEYQIQILYILQMKKPGTLRNYTLQQNDLTNKTCNIEARELKTAVKNIIHG